MWNSGRTQSERSLPSSSAAVSVRVIVSIYCAQAAVRLAWVSIAPFGRTGRAAGILDDRQRLGRVAERMGLEAPVVVEKIAERHAAFVIGDLGQHARRPSFAL